MEESPRLNRAKAEADAQNAVYDGRKRFKTGKKKAMIFRTTEEKHAQILRLADALGLGTGKTVSMTEVIEMAIDALAYRPVPAGAGPAVLRLVALRRERGAGGDTMESLFRPEAVAHNTRRLAREVLLAPPLPAPLRLRIIRPRDV